MQKQAFYVISLTAVLMILAVTPSSAQVRTRIPRDGIRIAQYQAGSDSRAVPSTAAPATTVPGTAPLTPVPATAVPSGQGSILGTPAFDPYAPSTGQVPSFGAPSVTMPDATMMPPASIHSGQTYPPGAFPSSTPPVLFPNGFPTQNVPILRSWAEPFRFFQGPRFQHTWLVADSPQDVEIHELDISGVFAVPNFLFLSQPLTIAPAFSLYLLDGPLTGAAQTPTADLPPRMYAAYVDAAWESDPNRQFGGEVAARVGVYTDFDTLNSDSLRIQGRGLLKYRFSPTLSLRGGVAYLDRLKIKMLPVGGLLWTPNPRTRWDVYFPRPKLSQYLTTLGNSDVWWYLGGEYGGGSFTIERSTKAGNPSDRIDINDLRASVGVEWGPSDMMMRGRRVGFIEAGYVWDREVQYLGFPADNFSPGDVFMIRGGFGY